MSWATTPVRRRRPPWYKFVLIWLIVGVLAVIDSLLTPYYLWRMLEDIRRANEVPVPYRRPTVHHQRPGAR